MPTQRPRDGDARSVGRRGGSPARERAALAFTEAVTRIADRPDPVSDELWSEVTALFSNREISALLFSIGTINVWNRINAAIRQPAGRR